MEPAWLSIAGDAGSALGGVTVFGAAITWLVDRRNTAESRRIALTTDVSALLDALDAIDSEVRRIQRQERQWDDYDTIRKTLNPAIRGVRIGLRGRRFQRVGEDVANRAQALVLELSALGPLPDKRVKVYIDWINTRRYVRSVVAGLIESDWKGIAKLRTDTPVLDQAEVMAALRAELKGPESQSGPPEKETPGPTT